MLCMHECVGGGCRVVVLNSQAHSRLDLSKVCLDGDYPRMLAASPTVSSHSSCCLQSWAQSCLFKESFNCIFCFARPSQGLQSIVHLWPPLGRSPLISNPPEVVVENLGQSWIHVVLIIPMLFPSDRWAVLWRRRYPLHLWHGECLCSCRLRFLTSQMCYFLFSSIWKKISLIFPQMNFFMHSCVFSFLQLWNIPLFVFSSEWH